MNKGINWNLRKKILERDNFICRKCKLEDNIGKQLKNWAKRSGKSRNMIIREAIKEWVLHHTIKTWPSSVLKFKGNPEIPPFENTRSELAPPKEDPFS